MLAILSELVFVAWMALSWASGWRSRCGRPSINREIRNVIRQMSGANPLWGAPRIHGELLKLGI